MPDGTPSLWRAGVMFLALVLGCAALIAVVAGVTGPRIDQNRANRFQQTLTDLTGSPARTAALVWQDDVAFLCGGTSPERALLRGAAAGYGGPIEWLAAVSLGPPVALDNLRITAHQETPGIADFLNKPEQGWLATLHGRTLNTLPNVHGISGATITTRALRRDLTGSLERVRPDQAVCPS